MCIAIEVITQSFLNNMDNLLSWSLYFSKWSRISLLELVWNSASLKCQSTGHLFTMTTWWVQVKRQPLSISDYSCTDVSTTSWLTSLSTWLECFTELNMMFRWFCTKPLFFTLFRTTPIHLNRKFCIQRKKVKMQFINSLMYAVETGFSPWAVKEVCWHLTIMSDWEWCSIHSMTYSCRYTLKKENLSPPNRSQTSDLLITSSDALPLSYMRLMRANRPLNFVHATNNLHTAGIWMLMCSLYTIE